MARMRAMLCVLLVATGCYSPGYVDCEVTCGVSGTCPDGLDCLGGVCRVGGNTGACGVPNGDGRTDDATDSGVTTDGPWIVGDEDGDMVLNGVDPCPISADNNDTDGDGVGDACEAITGGPDDSIVLFEGFDAQPGTAMVVGPWTFSGGSARIVSAVNRADSITFSNTAPSGRRTTVVAKVTIDQELTSTNSTTAGPVMRTDGANIGVACGFGFDPATNADVMQNVTLAAGADTKFSSIPVAVAAGTTYTVTASRNPANDSFSCSIPLNGTSYFPATAPTGTRAGIRTRSMSASFAWVMVIDSPD